MTIHPMSSADTEPADCDDCEEILDELENIDGETDRHGIMLVKVKDVPLANSYGCDQLPALVYFEQGMVSVYQDELTAESVLQWLLQQRSEDTIEEVNREILEHMVDSTHYLVVLFCKTDFSCLVSIDGRSFDGGYTCLWCDQTSR